MGRFPAPQLASLAKKPQLTLDKANETIDWYKEAFGATEIYRSLDPDGKVMHAEIHIGAKVPSSLSVDLSTAP